MIFIHETIVLRINSLGEKQEETLIYQGLLAFYDAVGKMHNVETG